jgi:predicted glycogen debranching enzyme
MAADVEGAVLVTRISIDGDAEKHLAKEWLEPDGLGGFASGTVALTRTRRYHALLCVATKPPAGRFVLWNGFDARVETPEGSYAISTQRYQPNVEHPDGAARLVKFESEPWPRYTFQLPASELVQEIFVVHGSPVAIVTFKLSKPIEGAKLFVRPFLSGRNFHALHRENSDFYFTASSERGEVAFQTYPPVPKISFLSGAEYRHEPAWYRNFEYSEEAARGLDHLEDLASPGTFEFNLD